MYSFNYCFLTYIQVSQAAGQVVWYSHLLKNFPQFGVIHTVKGFGAVHEAEESPCFFYNPAYVGNLISGSSAFSKSSLYIWKFSVHVMLKPNLKNFGYYLARMWNECNCMAIWTWFGISFLWSWRKTDLPQSCCLLLSFSNLLAYSLQHFKKNIYFLNWTIITLQNFVVFCQTSPWISHRYTYVPSLLNLPHISLPIPHL